LSKENETEAGWQKLGSGITGQPWHGKTNEMSNILTHMSSPPAEGNLYDEHGKALKLAIIQD